MENRIIKVILKYLFKKIALFKLIIYYYKLITNISSLSNRYIIKNYYFKIFSLLKVIKKKQNNPIPNYKLNISMKIYFFFCFQQITFL